MPYGFSIVGKGTVATPGRVSKGQIIKIFLALLPRPTTEISIKGMETNSGNMVSLLALRDHPNEDFF